MRLGFGVGMFRFWAWDEFLGRIVTDSHITMGGLILLCL